ncbi:hypothetical protein BJF90_24210 [Pseudonocardia sp. CNS-004]|nr:hypothetical protein BJF90_24210 [Pseudonocardia sp. CNS-004]
MSLNHFMTALEGAWPPSHIVDSEPRSRGRSLARTASRIIVPIVTAAFIPVTPRSSIMST